MTAPGVLAVMDECREIVATTLADPEGAETIGKARATAAELIAFVQQVEFLTRDAPRLEAVRTGALSRVAAKLLDDAGASRLTAGCGPARAGGDA